MGLKDIKIQQNGHSPRGQNSLFLEGREERDPQGFRELAGAHPETFTFQPLSKGSLRVPIILFEVGLFQLQMTANPTQTALGHKRAYIDLSIQKNSSLSPSLALLFFCVALFSISERWQYGCQQLLVYTLQVQIHRGSSFQTLGTKVRV